MPPFSIITVITSVSVVLALNNGLGRTPPMGWSTWPTFRCNISESLILNTAQAMVSSGMRDAGYQYVNIDDCWMLPRRDRYGTIQADPQKFPHGIKWLADQIHALDLKLGIYTCPGEKTCLGFPGAYEHEYQDAQTFADWGIDFVKYDNCFLYFNIRDIWIDEVYSGNWINNFTYFMSIEGVPGIGPWSPNAGGDLVFEDAYTLMRDALNATGRPMLYSISPLTSGCNTSLAAYYQNVAHICLNQCPQRDSTDTWQSLETRIDDFVRLNVGQFNQPGYFTDLDLLFVGSGGESFAQYKSWMSMYAVFASPLIAGNDLRNMTAETIELLTNKNVIAINQDPAGFAGVEVLNDTTNNVNIYVKKLQDSSFAVALLNRNSISSQSITLNWNYLKIAANTSLTVFDCWSGQNLGIFENSFQMKVDSYDCGLIHLREN